MTQEKNKNVLVELACRQIEQEMELADEPLKEVFRQEINKIRKWGRKPFPAGKARTNRISIRFTDGEIEFLRLIAEENERELAELVHELVVKAAEDKFLDKNQNDQ